MSNIVKFPGQDEEPIPDNLVSFPDAAERNPRRPTFFGVIKASAKALFKSVRCVAAFAVYMALVVPLGVLYGFKGLIAFFAVATSAILYWHDGLTYVYTAKVGNPTVYTFVTCLAFVVLSQSGKALCDWLTEKRIAFRLFGL